MPDLPNRKRLIAIIAVSLRLVLPAHAQQTDDLQKQLQQLRQQYEQTSREMQERITALEQQIQGRDEARPDQSKKEGTVSALQLAAEEAAKKAGLGDLSEDGQLLQGKLPSEPTYELLRDAEAKIDRLQEQVKSFEFHGYFRAGYGLNSRGGQQVPFQAPGAGAKFRLGNETETYGELIFANNWLNPEHDSSKAWMKTEFMVEADTTNSANYANFPGAIGNDRFRFREAFIQAGNILESQPAAKFWAGERYYRRQHIEIDDFYILDMSGYGAGIEDLNLRVGKMSMAYLAGARPDLITQNGNYAKSNLDVRLYDVHAPGGKLGGWFNFASAKGGTTQTGTIIPSTSGFAFGLAHQRLEWHGGYNWLSIGYGEGAASNFSTSIDDPNPFIHSSKRLQIAEHLLLQPNDKFAVMPIVIYQRTQSGDSRQGWNDWVSFGARPEVFFTKYLSLAFESGFDHTRSGSGQYEGWLRKFTIAPQIGAGRKFFSRPVLRLFATYASWSDGLRGLVGGTPFQNSTRGLTFGAQAETWF